MKRKYLSYAFLLLGLAMSSCDLYDDDWDIEVEECDDCLDRIVRTDGELVLFSKMETESARQSKGIPVMKGTSTMNDSGFGMSD